MKTHVSSSSYNTCVKFAGDRGSSQHEEVEYALKPSPIVWFVALEELSLSVFGLASTRGREGERERGRDRGGGGREGRRESVGVCVQ